MEDEKTVTFPIILGCDCDPDRCGFGGALSPDKKLIWRGLKDGIDRFRRARDIFYKQTTFWPKMTWFVRADYQIAELYGDAGYCLRQYKDVWKSLEQDGDEIAWHPHLWDWDKESKFWYQHIGNQEFTEKCFSVGLHGFGEAWGAIPQSMHAGWCYQDNITLSLCANSGIKVDCSALPGHNTMGGGIEDQADWSRCPNYPYYPDSENYQHTNTQIEKCLNILEVPASTGSHWRVKAIRLVREQWKRKSLSVNWKSFQKQTPLICLHALFNKPLAFDAIGETLMLPNPYFFSYCHSDEFLPTSFKKGVNRWLYDTKFLFDNLESILDFLYQRNLKPFSLTMSEFYWESQKMLCK